MVAKIPHNVKPVEEDKPIDLRTIVTSPALEPNLAKDMVLDFEDHTPKSSSSHATGSYGYGGRHAGGSGKKEKAPTKKELEAQALEKQIADEEAFKKEIADKIKATSPNYAMHTSIGINELLDRYFYNEYLPTIEKLSTDENGVKNEELMSYYQKLWMGYDDKKRGHVNGIWDIFAPDIQDKKNEEDENLTLANAVTNITNTSLVSKGSAAVRNMFASGMNSLAGLGNMFGIVDDETLDLTAATVRETAAGEEQQVAEAVLSNYKSKYEATRAIERNLDGRGGFAESLKESPLTTTFDAAASSILPMLMTVPVGGFVGAGAKALGMGAKTASTVGASIGAGTLGAMSVTNQAQTDIFGKSDEEIKESDFYKTRLNELKQQHPDWDDKKAEDEATALIPQMRIDMANKVSLPASASGFAVGAALGVVNPFEALGAKMATGSSGKVLGNIMSGSGAMGRAIKGVTAEALSEGLEEGLEQFQSNVAVNYGMGNPLLENAGEGVVDSALAGAVSGGPLGVTGALHKGNATNVTSATAENTDIGGDGENSGNTANSENAGGGSKSGVTSDAPVTSDNDNNNNYVSSAGQRHAARSAQNDSTINDLFKNAKSNVDGSLNASKSNSSASGADASVASNGANPIPSGKRNTPYTFGNVTEVTRGHISNALISGVDPNSNVDRTSDAYKNAMTNFENALKSMGLSDKDVSKWMNVANKLDNGGNRTVQDFNDNIQALLASLTRRTGARNADTGQSSGAGDTSNSSATPAGPQGSGSAQAPSPQGSQGNSDPTQSAGSGGAARQNSGASSGNIQSSQSSGNGAGSGANSGPNNQSNAGASSQSNTGNGGGSGSGVQQPSNANGPAPAGGNSQSGGNGVREKDLSYGQSLAKDVRDSCGNVVDAINSFVNSSVANASSNTELYEQLALMNKCKSIARKAYIQIKNTLGSLEPEYEELLFDVIYNYVNIHNSIADSGRKLTSANVEDHIEFKSDKSYFGYFKPGMVFSQEKIHISTAGKVRELLNTYTVEETKSFIITAVMHEMQHAIAREVAVTGSYINATAGQQISTNQEKARELINNLTARAIQLTQDPNSTFATNKNLVVQTTPKHVATSHAEMLSIAIEEALADPNKFVMSKVFDTPSKKNDFVSFIVEAYKKIYEFYSHCISLFHAKVSPTTAKFSKAIDSKPFYYERYRDLYRKAAASSQNSLDRQIYDNLISGFGSLWSLSTYNPIVAMQRQLGDISGVNKDANSEPVISAMFSSALKNAEARMPNSTPNAIYNSALSDCIKQIMPNIDAKSHDMLIAQYGVNEKLQNTLVSDILEENTRDPVTGERFRPELDINSRINVTKLGAANVFGVAPDTLEKQFRDKFEHNISVTITDPLNVGLPVSPIIVSSMDKTSIDVVKENVQEIDSISGDLLDSDNTESRQNMYLETYSNAADALNALDSKKTDGNIHDALEAVSVLESMNDEDPDYSENDMLFNSQRSLSDIIESTEFTADMNSHYDTRLDADERIVENNDVIPDKSQEEVVNEILEDSEAIIDGITLGNDDPTVVQTIASSEEFMQNYDGPRDENGNPTIQYIKFGVNGAEIVAEDDGSFNIMPAYINSDGTFQGIHQKEYMDFISVGGGSAAWVQLDAAQQAGELLNASKQKKTLNNFDNAVGVKTNKYMRFCTKMRELFADKQAHFRSWCMTRLSQTDGTTSDANALYTTYAHLQSDTRGAKAEIADNFVNERTKGFESVCTPVMQAQGVKDTRAYVSQMAQYFGTYRTLMHTIEASYKQEADIKQAIIDTHARLTDEADNEFNDWYQKELAKGNIPTPQQIQNVSDALYDERDRKFLEQTAQLQQDLADLQLQQASGCVTKNNKKIAPFGGRTRIECVKELNDLFNTVGAMLPQGVDAKQFLESGNAVMNNELQNLITTIAAKGLLTQSYIENFGDFNYYTPLTVQQNKDANALDHMGVHGSRLDFRRGGSHTPAQNAVSAITAMEGSIARNMATADFGRNCVYYYEQMKQGVKPYELEHNSAYGLQGVKSYDGFVVISAGDLQAAHQAALENGCADLFTDAYGTIIQRLMYVNTSVMKLADDLYTYEVDPVTMQKVPVLVMKKGTIIASKDQIQTLEDTTHMSYDSLVGSIVRSESSGYYIGFDLNSANSMNATQEEKDAYTAELKKVQDSFHSAVESDIKKDKLTGALAFVTNSIAQLWTTFNMCFAPRNALKDTKERLTYVTARNYRKADGSIASGFRIGITMRKKLFSPAWYVRMTKAIWSKGNLPNPNNDPKIARANELAKVFIYKGIGSTSNIQTTFEHEANMLANDLHSDELLGAFSAEDRGFIRRNTAKITAVFRRWAEMWYAIPAMSQLESMYEHGIDMEDAVFHTKSLMNLDQKGTFLGRSFIRSFIPFVSSIGQGALQHTFSLTGGIDMANPANRAAAVKQVTKSIGIMAYQVAKYTALIQLAMLCMPGDNDEDKARKLETIFRDDAVPLILDGETAINWPVAFGPEKMAWTMAKDMFRFSHGHTDVGSMAANLLSSYIHNVAPMGNPQFDFSDDPFAYIGFSLTGGSPLLNAVVAMTAGKTQYGTNLKPRYTSPGDRRSDYYSVGTNSWYVDVAQSIYDWTGGFVNATPAEAKYLANTFLTGPFRAIIQVFEDKNNPLKGSRLDKSKGGPIMAAFGATSLYTKITEASYLEIDRASNYYESIIRKYGVSDALKGTGKDGTNASKRRDELLRMGMHPREVEDVIILANYRKESIKLTGEYKRAIMSARALHNENFERMKLEQLAIQQDLLNKNTVKSLYFYSREFKRNDTLRNNVYAEHARFRSQVIGASK